MNCLFDHLAKTLKDRGMTQTLTSGESFYVVVFDTTKR